MRFYVLCLILYWPVLLLAQDDVFKIEEPSRGFFDLYTQFTIVENQNESPLAWGGGFGVSYTKNVFALKPLFIGGEFSYVFTGSDKISYAEDDYLQNSSSLMNLNVLLQYRYFRNKPWAVYPEISLGMLMPGYSSSYYYYDEGADEEVGDLEKMRILFAGNMGVGIGFRFFNYINLKFRYQVSTPVKHIHPSQVYETSSDIYYPYVKVSIHRFEIYAAISLNRIR